MTSPLPRPLSSFVGRQDLLARAAALLARDRLLTLTGPGGSGKTRVAIELAGQVRAHFPDGVTFVALADIRDAALVPSAIAQGLGLQDSRGRPLVQHLRAYLAERTVLLVLDNFEQVMGAATAVTDLLTVPTGSRIVVTSRGRLHVSGEQELPVPPLPVPEYAGRASPTSLEGCESTALFLARARAVVPTFAPEGAEATAVAGIARRLDGLPLAIELAAARTKLLPPSVLLERLDRSLSLLVGGNRDLPDRQQTLRRTVGWSHDLLSEDAQRLFAALAVFRGDAGLDDVEAVCGDTVRLGTSVLDAIDELLDQSLLHRSERAPQPRYAMLETVRAFADEKLSVSTDFAPIHQAHADRFAQLTGCLQRPPVWPDGDLLVRLDADFDNVRAALDWLQNRDPMRAMLMAAQLTTYWSLRGHFGEGRQRLGDLLSRCSGPSRERIAGLNAAGWLAVDQGDLGLSSSLLTESLELSRAIGDRVGEGTALVNRGRARLGGQDIEAGGADVAGALAVFTEVRDGVGVAVALMFSGLAPLFTGQVESACSIFARCVGHCEQLGLRALRARAQQLLGVARLLAGDAEGARAALQEGVPVVVAFGDRFGIVVGIGALTKLAAATDRPRLALRLVGVLDEFAEVNQVVPPQPLRELTDRFLTTARAAAGDLVGSLRAEGRRLDLGEAVAEALTEGKEEPWRSGLGPALTAREVEVARLVAGGLTNREVAARLFLSVRTVEVHVDHVLTKLGFHSRGQLSAWAHEQGLLPRNT